MIKQKVITVNINTLKPYNSEGHIHEMELQTINDYLDQGYTIVDRFSTTTQSELHINKTFTLQKETEE